MDSIGNYQTYKKKMTFDSLKYYPSLLKLTLFFIGFLDIVFGSIFLLVALYKGLFDLSVFGLIFLSWVGGVSCLIVGKQPDLKKLNVLLLFGLIIGFTLGIFYIYLIVRNYR